MNRTIFFHHPLPLNYNATSASGIRPCKIYDAFVALGFTVIEITGYSKERKRKIKEIKKSIRNGLKVEFCYSESSTMPTALTDKHHLPLHPFLDSRFFKFLFKNEIPVKLFYRDIYWKFADYSKNVNFIERIVASIFYKYDLAVYKKYLSTLFLPSLQMKKYLPELNLVSTKELPAGTEIQNCNEITNNQLSLLYIGGIGNHYNLQKLFSAVSNILNVDLTVCVRNFDWNKVSSDYVVSENIKVVHESGKKLQELYKNSSIAILFVKASQYWSFAVPYKLFEYLSYGKPIIASNNTWVGEYVQKNDIGWTIDYSEMAIMELLLFLSENPLEISKKTENVKKIALDNTWQQRCLTIERS